MDSEETRNLLFEYFVGAKTLTIASGFFDGGFADGSGAVTTIGRRSAQK
jgi:hypothetical protein